MDQNGLLKNLEFWAENCDRTNTGCQAAFVLRDAKTLIEDLYARCKRLEEARERANEAAHQWEGRCKILETRLETAEKMVKEYQDVIVPGYRERAEKAEKERDAAVSDLTFAVNQYRLFTTDIDLCGLCKFALPPAGESGQTAECPGFYKDNCFEWRGAKEE